MLFRSYRSDNNINSMDVEYNFDKRVSIVLQISSIKEVVTKKNDVMAFVAAGDEFGVVDLTLFPDNYQKYNNIRVGNIIEIIGRVEKRFDRYQIVVNDLEILE